ncbi:ABC-type antimicrobial peptide transport system permease subunit [Parabacteroides sp. PFB2-10]|uniref:ABC transporter permease n=1 Tax=Parabacteroides sp. PFB2-10 TaxID=1742405 RepID=UPI0024745451|nr:FtsX-like permease family protein [Parabacteroides sp. PFB2-10]MDH6312974.1 ABC-type antimicrobial peptide transport system permease subunit [Parabacteroides sp. PFB2-10]
MKIILLALRSLTRTRLYSIVNILGLSLCLICVVVISRYIYGELTVDRFNQKLDRIYITHQEDSNNPGKSRFHGIENRNREKNFRDMSEHPGVERHTLFYTFTDMEVKSSDKALNSLTVVVDTNFLQILDYPVIMGQANISRPEDAFITEEFAQKMFGKENPIGKSLEYSSLGKHVTVAGVIGKSVMKSTIRFDMLISSDISSHWSRAGQSLLLLYPGVDYKDINAQYDFMFMESWKYSIKLQLFPYKDLYFEQSIVDYVPFLHGKRTNVVTLSMVGFLILLIGVVNFINIYTVVVMRRGREFGMKKVFGAEGFWVFFQLFIENFAMILFALLIALGVAEVLNPFVKNVLGFDQLPYRSFDLMLSLSILFGLPLVTTIFPFLRYNYSAPVSSLKDVTVGGGAHFSRRIFLMIQYVATYGMIILSLFFVCQLYFMLQADPGYRVQDVIKVPFLREMTSYASQGDDAWEEEKRLYDEIRQKLDASPLILNWTNAGTPNRQNNRGFDFRLEGGELKPMALFDADERWLKLFEVELLEGRLFDDQEDSFYGYNLIVGESALKQFGITDWQTQGLQPYQRIWLIAGREEEMKTNPAYKIVGVIKDIYTSHLSETQHPVAIYYSGGGGLYEPVVASFAPERRKEVIAFMQQLHAETVGGEFTYSFLEDEVAAVYKEDKKIALIYSLFTLIAIIISSLGLFSMSLFDVQQQRKSIAIRKVNGATTREIIRMLLKRYIVLLAVSFVVALPVSWLIIQNYLKDFAHKAPVSWWIFAVALLITCSVSLLTLVWQIRKAAETNPAEAIKTE